MPLAQKKALKEREAAEEAKAAAALAKSEAIKKEQAEKKAAAAAAAKAKKEAAALAAAEVRQPGPTAAPPCRRLELSLTPGSDRACVTGQGGKGEQLRPDGRFCEEGRRVRHGSEGGRACRAHRRTGGCGRRSAQALRPVSSASCLSADDGSSRSCRAPSFSGARSD